MKSVYLKNGMRLNDRYIIEKVLGQGGFGITYLASDGEIRQSVVVKEFFPVNLVDRGEDESEIRLLRQEDRPVFQKAGKRFLEEARALATLQAVPEIVKVLNYFEENGTAYFVMEYVRGSSLRTYAERLDELPDFAACKTMLHPVIRALQAVHEKGLIHRDITPDNLLIKEDGTIKIIDFGSAREYAEDDRTRTVLVKAGYAPLEQYSSKGRQGAWTDVYSLCAVFYELLTGAALPDALKRAGGEEVYPPSLYGAQITAEEEAVLMKGLAQDHKDRIKNMAALETAFFPEKAVSSAKETKHRKTLVLTVLILALCGAAVGIYRYGKEKTENPGVVSAGNYARFSKRHQEFQEFVKKHAVAEEENDRGVRYTLDAEDVKQWGEPSNKRKFSRKKSVFQKYLEETGYEGSWTDGGETYTAEIGTYGAIRTEFEKELVYTDDSGLFMRLFYDPVDERILKIKVSSGGSPADAAFDVFSCLTEYPAEDAEEIKEKWLQGETEKRNKKDKVLISFSWADVNLLFTWVKDRQEMMYQFLPFSIMQYDTMETYDWP